MSKELSDDEVEAIRADIAKYPAQAAHEPVTYCRALLAHIDALYDEISDLRGQLMDAAERD